MNKPKIAVIVGSIRESRLGERVASWFMDTVKDMETAELSLIDLKDHPLPLFADSTPPSVRTGTHENPAVQTWLDLISAADGFIFITAEYNHSVPGALKNAIDYGFAEWNNKSVGFVSYGSAAGGARAAEHLRQIASELHMHDVRDQVLIPTIWAAFDEQGNLQNHDMYAKAARTVLESVAELAIKLRS